MKIDEVVAVSQLSGLYKLVANRNNGLIVEDFDSGKRKFAASRKHQFTPLATIGIYTDDDTEELRVVFRNMLEKLESDPPVALNATSTEISAYFAKILPNYDTDRVYLSDIKKVIKWFNFLNDRKLLTLEDLSEEATAEEEPKAEKPEAEEKTEKE